VKKNVECLYLKREPTTGKERYGGKNKSAPARRENRGGSLLWRIVKGGQEAKKILG